MSFKIIKQAETPVFLYLYLKIIGARPMGRADYTTKSTLCQYFFQKNLHKNHLKIPEIFVHFVQKGVRIYLHFILSQGPQVQTEAYGTAAETALDFIKIL